MVKFRRIKVILISLIVIFSAVSLLSVKNKEFGRKVLDIGKFKYHGDLFEMARLWRFMDNTPVNWKDFKTDINDADVIIMGDSFLVSNHETPKVSYQLQDITGKKVHHVKREDFKAVADNPLLYFDKINYQKGKAKYLILEVVERYSMDTSTYYQYTNMKDYTNFLNSTQNTKVPEKVEYTSDVKKLIEPSNLQYFFYNNIFMAPFYEIGKNFRFEVLGEIDDRTPLYFKDPAMLFYFEDVEFAKTNTEKKYIDMMANNINLLGKILKEKYDLELIFALMPTKYTVYGKYDKNYKGYNNFIPSVYDSLNKLKVNTVDVYSIYKDMKNIDKDLLYYKGDSHYTPRGKKVLVDELVKKINELDKKKKS